MNQALSFTIDHTDAGSRARTGLLRTSHGAINTPAFMPVGTLGTIKSLTPDELREAGVEIILCNTYHLLLRPGRDVIVSMGGLHRFINWPSPILTDSGGFQTYSLQKLVRVTEDGVSIASPLDGTRHFLSPEAIIEIQQDLGSDILMPLDDCPPFPATRKRVERAVHLTNMWVMRSKDSLTRKNQALFCIVQGGIFHDLRRRSASELAEISFDGYALGGFSVGEPSDLREETIHETASCLPEDKPRYLMGMGTPADILKAVMEGIDLFDCVLPTRAARNGLLFTSSGKISLKRSIYAKDPSPPDRSCSCYTCSKYSLAYLRHIFLSKEILASRLNTIHNVWYYMNIMKTIRTAIQKNKLQELERCIPV